MSNFGIRGQTCLQQLIKKTCESLVHGYTI